MEERKGGCWVQAPIQVGDKNGIRQVIRMAQTKFLPLDRVRSDQNLGYILEAMPIDLLFWGLRKTQISGHEGLDLELL